MNSDTFNDVYGRKSPIFLVEIVTLVSTLIVRTYPSQNSTFNTFTLVILIFAVTEIVIKGINLTRLCHFENSQIEGYITIIFAVAHVGLLIYGAILFFNRNYREKNQRFQPQWFYLKVYVLVYTSLIVGLILSFVVAAILGFCLLRLRGRSQHSVS